MLKPVEYDQEWSSRMSAYEIKFYKSDVEDVDSKARPDRVVECFKVATRAILGFGQDLTGLRKHVQA